MPPLSELVFRSPFSMRLAVKHVAPQALSRSSMLQQLLSAKRALSVNAHQRFNNQNKSVLPNPAHQHTVVTLS
jgi:hypothetical protein